MEMACAILLDAAARRRPGYVCVRDVNGVMASMRDARLLDIHNNSLLTVPDGVPNVWIGRLSGQHRMKRVYGPDLMLEICRRGVPLGCKHFFCGGKPGIVDTLSRRLKERIPGLHIAGTMTPPFRPLTTDESGELHRLMDDLRPDFFWVGISTPKQELFMAEHAFQMQAGIMIGVGAAFDIHAGVLRDAPGWIKPTGFQWLFRLCQEPRRLWRRYLLHNPAFLYHVFMQLTGLRKYPMNTN